MGFFKIKIDLLNLSKHTQFEKESDFDCIHYQNNEFEWIAQIQNLDKKYYTEPRLIFEEFLYEKANFFGNLHFGFVIILIDKKHKSVKLYRDLFGIKPLFFSQKDEILEISNQIKPLAKTIDHNYIREYLEDEFDDEVISENTFFSNVKRVLPGHENEFSVNGFQKKPNLLLFNLENAKEGFKDILEKNVIEITQNHKSNAAHLSGGLDSSSIVAFANSENPISTFYFDAGPGTNDEKSLSKLVSDYFKTNHHFVENQNDFLEKSYETCEKKYQPELLLFPSDVFVQIANATDGSQTIISGHGGDTIVGNGFEYLDFLFESRKSKKFQIAANQYWAKKKNIISDKQQTNFRDFLTFFFLRKLKSERIPKEFFRTFFWGISNLNINLLLLPKVVFMKFFSSKRRKIKPEKKKEKSFSEIFIPEADKYQKAQFDSNFVRLSANALESLSVLYDYEKIEPFYPFLDAKLLSISLITPLESKFYSGMGRGVLRENLDGILPNEIHQRVTKGAFNDFSLRVFKDMWPKMESKLKSNHSVWKYADQKRCFESAALIFNFTEKQNHQDLWYCQKVINLAIWLDILE